MPLPHYLSIKDNYCIAYFGSNKEYILQLSLLRPLVESKYVGLNVYICCRDDFIYLLEKEERIYCKSNLDKNNFAYIRELKDSLDYHPIERLMKESDINCGPICLTKKEKKIKKTALLTNGNFPTRSLNCKQINDAIKIIENNKNEYQINPIIDREWYLNFDSVMGVENEHLYKAASLGLDTTLIPTGIGENLFISMFPNNQIKYLKE